MVEVKGISSGEVKFVEIRRNTKSEGTLLGHYWHSLTKARGANEIRYLGSPSPKLWILDVERFISYSVVANALSIPPGKYARKSETQRNWRGPAQAVEYVV